MKSCLVVCTTDSMIWNFLIPHINNMKKHGIRVECACSRTGVYFDELVNKFHLKVFEVPFHRSPYSVENLKAYSFLKVIVKKRKIDTIWCHEPVGGALGRLAGHACGVRVVYMAHGFHFFKGAPKKDLIYYYVEKYLAKYTDLLITINQEDYDAANNFKAKRVALVNGIGVNLDKFHKYNSNFLREHYSLDADDVVLLTVGEMIQRKNHEVVIRALAKIDNKKLHFFIAGDGELEGYLKKLAKELGVQKQVHFLGFCRNVADLYNSCDIFIFPSFQEGLSMALMEAMACGKPVIASKIRGNTDLLVSGKGGFLIDNRVDKYQDAIIRMISQRSHWSDYGTFNEEHVKQFGLQIVEPQLFELLTEEE